MSHVLSVQEVAAGILRPGDPLQDPYRKVKLSFAQYWPRIGSLNNKLRPAAVT